MVRKFFVAALLAGAVAGLQAQDAPAPTPREAWNHVQNLVAEDHGFTADEITALAVLEEQLAGDEDLASQVHLLRLALATRSAADQARAESAQRLADEAAAFESRETLVKNQGAWRLSRDLGLWGLGLSTVSILGLTAAIDRVDNAYGHDAENVQVMIRWALAGSLATAVLSLFPLAWGEVRL